MAYAPNELTLNATEYYSLFSMIFDKVYHRESQCEAWVEAGQVWYEDTHRNLCIPNICGHNLLRT